jgi:hypothetical protein
MPDRCTNIRDGDHVKATVEGGPGFTGTVLDIDPDDGDVLIECDQCKPNTAHYASIADVRRITDA